ncbi:MAG: hypothetical protein NDJ72_11395 [Elusimicrobia bacterium]|nr:hypothetical protein [Elusimicrobiota bacterium]
MISDSALLLFAVCILGGLGLLAWSLLSRARRNLLAGIEEAALADLGFGRTVGVSGVADAPAPLASPVSNTPCVFYEKQVDVQHTLSPEPGDAGDALAMGLTMAGKLGWVGESVDHAGGFFLMDGGAKAFVFPRGAKLRIAGEHQNSVQDPGVDVTRRITERFIPQGRTVCVIGRPHRLDEAFAAIQRDIGLPPETLKKLGEAGPIPCFFDDGAGTFIVADMAFPDLRADAAESADSLFWAGLAMLGMGVFLVIAFVFRLI